MKRWGMIVLILSLALNLGFAASWVTQRGIARWQNTGRHPPWGRSGAPHFPGDARRGGARGDWAQRRTHWLEQRLHLDGERQRELGDSLRPLAPAWLQAREDLEEARKAFHEEMMQPLIDHDRALALSAKISRKQARLDSLTTEALVREARVLRPEERHRPGKWFPRR